MWRVYLQIYAIKTISTYSLNLTYNKCAINLYHNNDQGAEGEKRETHTEREREDKREWEMRRGGIKRDY